MFLAEFFSGLDGSLAELFLVVFFILLLADLAMLYQHRNGISAERIVPERLSNGDENRVQAEVRSHYRFQLSATLIDELPEQFQVRDFELAISLEPGQKQTFQYELRPTERGEYKFGHLLIFARSKIGLIKRKYTFEESETLVAVYPSFKQMRKFELIAFSNRATDAGIKKIRRRGHTMEFDRIKEYVQGDDVRSINWKATARANQMMVNSYHDERSQQVISVIDTGRVMKLPFNGLRLLDYAINTSLVISNIALLKEDKAGLITFSNRGAVVVKPQKKRTHIRNIQETLFNVETNFLESDFQRLLVTLKKKIHGRSLVLLYTNFESLSSMERRLPVLRQISKDHLLVTIFFKNTELNNILRSEPQTLKEIYTKTIAEKFVYEKRQIVKTLNKYGIHTILTPPEELSVQAINKYLELKARGVI